MKRYIYFSVIAFIFFALAYDVFAGWTKAYAPATFNSKDCSNEEAPADAASYRGGIDAANKGWTNFVDCITNLGFKGQTLEKDGGVLYGSVSIVGPGLTRYTFGGYPTDTADGAFCRMGPFGSGYADWRQLFSCIALTSRTIFFSKKVFAPPPPPPKQYSLNIYTEGNGQGFISGPNINCGDKCQAFYDASAVVNITAFPDINSYSYFVSWSGVNCGGWDYSPVKVWYSSSCNILMSEDKSVTARFSSFTLPPPPISSFSLEIKKTGSGSGVISGFGINCGSVCSVNYNTGTEVTLTALPSNDSAFIGWSGDCSGTSNCVVNFNGNKSVTAQFDIGSPTVTPVVQDFLLSVNKTGTAVGIVKAEGIYCGDDCSENYPSGAKVTLSALYSLGAAFGGWSGACSGQGPCIITMDGPKSVTAKFSPAYDWRTFYGGGNGGGGGGGGSGGTGPGFFILKYIKEILPF